MSKHIRSLEIGTPGEKPKQSTATAKEKVVSIDRSFHDTVQEIIGPDLRSSGSVSGLLERVNLHNANKFDIYPAVGPKRVRCVFDANLMEDVRSGLKKRVTVSGMLRFKEWDEHPYAVDAKTIDVHEDDSTLSSIYDLQGIAPDATGKVSSEDFVRMIRETNW